MQGSGRRARKGEDSSNQSWLDERVMEQMKRHIYMATRTIARDNALPTILASFNQDQPCPACLGVGSAGLDIDEIGKRSASLRFSGSSRTVNNWFLHFKTQHEVRDTCACGYVYTSSFDQQVMHLATGHNLCATLLG